MSEVQTLYEYKTIPGEKLKFTVGDYKGKRYYHIRSYVRSNDFANGEVLWLPTKKGVSFTLEEFPEFTKGLLKLKEHIDDNRS